MSFRKILDEHRQLYGTSSATIVQHPSAPATFDLVDPREQVHPTPDDYERLDLQQAVERLVMKHGAKRVMTTTRSTSVAPEGTWPRVWRPPRIWASFSPQR